ncbi:MAG TPA: phosphatidylserine/phosphatidylglycerophosphate/cardiolipin synthase family protein [Candidatus Ozemobacteraceae bacterium]|nr:phosphatidylserine/phosphatidylglycerophosphate/cardiolipin synthase family protein [Candidatus Ozemobacteraceae bacterium]
MNKTHWLFNCLLVLLLLVATGAAYAGKQAPVPTTGVEDCFDRMSAEFDAKALVRFMPDNVTAWYARWYIMENARHSIDTTYFIVEPDIFGKSMLGMLLKKAREGIEIRLMVDARGTKGLARKFIGQDILQELAKFKNVTVRVYNPVSSKLLAAFEDIRKITASNHDKILLVDGEYLITGGRNISMNYFVDPRDVPTVYRDTDVVIRSKLVSKQALEAFESEFKAGSNYAVGGDVFGNIDDMHRHLDIAYQAMRRYMLGGGMFELRDPKKFSSETQSLVGAVNAELKLYPHLVGYSDFRLFQGEHAWPVRLLDKHSRTGFKNEITFNLISLMDSAKSEIIIQNPYVVLTPEAEAALQRASNRGVKIIIQTNSPMSSDSLLTQAMFLGDWREILKKMPTAEIYAYKLQNKLHSKVFVFDRTIAVIGTYNMDYVSEQINSEEVAVVKSKPFATQVANRIAEDMRNSHQYQIEVQADGSIKTLFGPESHSDPKVLDRLKLLMKLNWLRPLI